MCGGLVYRVLQVFSAIDFFPSTAGVAGERQNVYLLPRALVKSVKIV